jgi:hypothetical protein
LQFLTTNLFISYKFNKFDIIAVSFNFFLFIILPFSVLPSVGSNCLLLLHAGSMLSMLYHLKSYTLD